MWIVCVGGSANAYKYSAGRDRAGLLVVRVLSGFAD